MAARKRGARAGVTRSKSKRALPVALAKRAASLALARKERLVAEARGLIELVRRRKEQVAAAYLAVAHRAQAMALPFSSTKDAYYRHDTLPDDARRTGIVDDGGRQHLEHLRDLRVKADYLDFEEADQAVALAEERVERVLGLGGRP